MNQQLTNFYDHLNTSVITTNDFAEGTLFRKREKVNQFAYCGLNPVYRKYLSFDLDYPDAGHKFEELKVLAGTPRPEQHIGNVRSRRRKERA